MGSNQRSADAIEQSDPQDLLSASKTETDDHVVIVQVSPSEEILHSPAVGPKAGEMVQPIAIGGGKCNVVVTTALVGDQWCVEPAPLQGLVERFDIGVAQFMPVVFD